MTAKEARLITTNSAQKIHALDEIRIRRMVNTILDEVREIASEGQSSMVFSPMGAKHPDEIRVVHRRLTELGYKFCTDESDSGYKFSLITW